MQPVTLSSYESPFPFPKVKGIEVKQAIRYTALRIAEAQKRTKIDAETLNVRFFGTGAYVQFDKTLRWNKPYAKGKIVLPGMADDLPVIRKVANYWIGYSCHEILHMIYSRGTIGETARWLRKLHHAVWNGLEDPRIEWLAEQDGFAPGASYCIRALVGMMIDRAKSEMAQGKSSMADVRNVPFLLATKLRGYNVGEDDLLDAAPREFVELVEYADAEYQRIRQTPEFAHPMSGSDTLYDLADEIFKRLREIDEAAKQRKQEQQQQEPEPEPEPSDEQTDDQQEPDDDGDQADEQAGEDEPADDGEPQESASEPEPDSEPDEPDEPAEPEDEPEIEPEPEDDGEDGGDPADDEDDHVADDDERSNGPGHDEPEVDERNERHDEDESDEVEPEPDVEPLDDEADEQTDSEPEPYASEPVSDESEPEPDESEPDESDDDETAGKGSGKGTGRPDVEPTDDGVDYAAPDLDVEPELEGLDQGGYIDEPMVSVTTLPALSLPGDGDFARPLVDPTALGRVKYMVRRMLSRTDRAEYRRGLKSGRLNPKALHRIAVGAETVFQRRLEISGSNTLVQVLIDLSGSMYDYGSDDEGQAEKAKAQAKVSVAINSNQMGTEQALRELYNCGTRIFHAASCAAQLSVAMQSCAGVKYEVVGFTDFDIQTRKEVTAKSHDAGYGVCAWELASVLYEFKRVTDPVSVALTRLRHMIRLMQGGTPCIASLKAGVDRIKNVSGFNRKFVMFITDADFGGELAGFRTLIDLYERKGITVIGIGVAAKERQLTQAFKYSVNVKQPKDLTGATMEKLVAVIAKQSERGLRS